MRDEAQMQVVQRGGGWPIQANIQSQARWGSEQSDLMEDVPALCRMGEIGDF